jgi:phosphatidylinositol alpha-1,6-mannosyltransferase
MNNQKSLLIPGDFPPEVSGIATYFFEIWKFYDPENHYILTAKYKNYKKFDKQAGLNIIRTEIPTGDSIIHKIIKSIIYTVKTLYLHRKHNFQLIHCGQVLSSGMTGWLMKKLYNLPYIVYVYGSETYRFGNNQLLMKLIRTFLRNADSIVPNSKFTLQEFLALDIPREKFKIITPGVDTNRFQPENRDRELVEKYGLTNKKVLLTVARLDERKGHDKVIEAVAALKNEIPDIIYLIVGKGREQKRLKSLAKKLKVKDHVIFCGYVSDNELPKYYNLCDTFILLNRQTTQDENLSGDYEGFIADAVEDTKSGYIIDGEDLSAITTTIKKLLLNDFNKIQIGKYGRERVVQDFTWKKIARDLKASFTN